MKTNRYDKFIETLADSFSKIPNFNLTQEEEKGKYLFNFVTKRLAEIQAFKFLISNYYLPAASRATIEGLKEIKKSKYSHLINLTREDLKENYHETVRLGYIGAFHKFENFMRELVSSAEYLISDIETDNNSLEDYTKKEFNYRIIDWKNYPTVSRLNWICNCIKHYDGYPLKNPVPKTYSHLPKNLKLTFTKEEFIKDIDKLIEQNVSIMQLTFMLAIYKMTFDIGGGGESPNTFRPGIETEQAKEKIKNSIENLIEINKKLVELE